MANDSFNARHTKQVNQYVDQIHSGTSFFQVIPEELGNILYCDTSNDNAASKTAEEIKKHIIIVLSICLGIIGLMWLLMPSKIGLCSIISAVVLFFSIRHCIKSTKFNGTDYFIGTNGFAILDFEGQRNNIVSKRLHLFDDLSELMTSETYKKKNYTYVGTDYLFAFMGKVDHNNLTDIAIEVSGEYQQEKPKDEIYNTVYLYWKKVEEIWTEYLFKKKDAEIKQNQEITFNLLVYDKPTDKIKCVPYVVFGDARIVVGDREYNNSNLKSIYFDNGNLVIEHINHTKKLLGLIEKGNIERIPLSNVGNKKMFLKILNSMTKYGIQ